MPVFAGTISGQIQTATGGVIANGTLTFTLSQPAVLAGTALLTQTSASCYTSNVGNIESFPRRKFSASETRYQFLTTRLSLVGSLRGLRAPSRAVDR